MMETENIQNKEKTPLEEKTPEENVKEVPVRKFYLNKDELKNLGMRDSVAEYMQGIIHQDKILYIQVNVLPRLGLKQDNPFRVIDNKGQIVSNYYSTGWISIEVPANSKKLKVSIKDEEKQPKQSKERKNPKGKK